MTQPIFDADGSAWSRPTSEYLEQVIADTENCLPESHTAILRAALLASRKRIAELEQREQDLIARSRDYFDEMKKLETQLAAVEESKPPPRLIVEDICTGLIAGRYHVETHGDDHQPGDPVGRLVWRIALGPIPSDRAIGKGDVKIDYLTFCAFRSAVVLAQFASKNPVSNDSVWQESFRGALKLLDIPHSQSGSVKS